MDIGHLRLAPAKVLIEDQYWQGGPRSCGFQVKAHSSKVARPKNVLHWSLRPARAPREKIRMSQKDTHFFTLYYAILYMYISAGSSYCAMQS